MPAPRPAVRPALEEAGRRAFRAGGMATAALRPLPEFLLVGTKRGGTTSLYYGLLQHPNVLPLFPSARVVPKRRDTKGVHYFDTSYQHGAAWYRSWFPSALSRAAVRRRTGAPAITGEAPPYYLFHPDAARRAAALVPDARLLALLRHPVERSHSAWKEQVRNGVETLSFEDALAAEDDRVGEEEQRLLDDERHVSFAHEFQSYARQSDYAVSVRRWLDHYPASRLLVRTSEDFYRRSNGVLDEVTDFLGLRPYAGWQPQALNAAAGSGIAPATRARLNSRFAPGVAELEALLGRSLGWDL
jgi:hypothetical protein